MRLLILAIAALSLWANSAYAQFGRLGAGGGNRSGTSVPYLTTNNGFPRLQTALKNPANQIVPCFGESSGAAGWGAFYNASVTGSDERSGSMCSQVAFQLRMMGYNVRTNSVSGNANTGTTAGTGAAAAAAYAGYDKRVSPGTWITGANATTACNFSVSTAGFNGNIAFGGCAWNSVDNVSSFTFTPQDTANYPSNTGNADASGTDTLDVWWLSLNGALAGTLSIDNGGTACGTINTGGTGTLFSINKTTITCASPGTLWHVKASAGTSYFYMLNARLSTAPEISLINMGFAGATTTLWLNNGPDSATTVLATIAALNPVGAIFQDVGNNIGQGISTGTTQTQTSTIISTLQATADVLLVTTNPQKPAATVGGGASPYDTQQSYVTAQINAANSNKAAYFDWFKLQCGTITGTGGSATASKACWNGQGTGFNAINAGGAADPDHQGVAAYSAQGVYEAMAIRPPVPLN